MIQEWYKLEFKCEDNCKLSEKEVEMAMVKGLEEIGCDYLGENFESVDWGYWETMTLDLCKISQKLPGVLISVSSESQDLSGDDKYFKHYVKEGQVELVPGQIVYPDYGQSAIHKVKQEYISRYIQNEIDKYADTGVEDDVIDGVNMSKACIEAICKYAENFNDITTEESARYRAPFYEEFADLLIN